jgi:transposase
MAKNQKHIVKLTDAERAELNRIVSSESKTLSHEVKVRAKALLCLDENGDNALNPAQAAVKCKLHRETVYDIRRQFCAYGLESAVYRKKRANGSNPPKVTGDVEAGIIACACSAPPDGMSKWTLKLIADKIMLDGVVDYISKESVRRTLKKLNLSLT